ncbi:GntR family transcriptional regulator [Amphritea sp.]|uniref:GntR family transcriptional regulator n=1 Tax=Amphritea sp. TaxID=1872502 RepID=UPI0025B7F8AD|nr:GntR family transcriptional regulator [Amphritea sp.]
MKETDSSVAYLRLRGDILDGSIEPSSKLSISLLTGKYETSAAPVREALSRLSAEGLVARKGQRGYWAAPVSLEEFKEVSRLRLMLEVDAFRQSIEHGSLDWEAEIAGARHREMTIRKQAFENDMGGDKVGSLIKENRRFHMALISACPSVWQLRFISTLFDQSERFRRLSLINKGHKSKEESVDDHQLIMDAAFRREIDEASNLLFNHIERSNAQVIETLFD